MEKRKRSSDDGEKSSKKHRDTEEKSGKREKRKDKKSHKHRSGEEKKSKDKSKSKHRKYKLDIQELSADDYFAKNNEFATWLKEEKDIFFSDLSSKSAREMFSDFINAWNKRKLDSRYYEGIVSGPRTAHNWKIKQAVKE